jgi:hypothetical protein
MNIFNVSHALLEIEDRVKQGGLRDNQVILFYMWLSEDKFPGHTFDDAFISKAIKEMKALVKEFDEWAHKEAMESLRNPSEPQ